MPVLLSTMPLVPPFAEMLWNVRSFAPIVVLTTFSAVPPADVIVLPLPSTVTVPPVVAAGPPPVALKPAPEVVVMASPPFVNAIVAPALSVRLTPVAVVLLIDLLAPENVISARGVVVEQDAGIGGDIVGDVAGERDVAGARGAVLDVDRLARAVGLGDRARIGDRGRAAGAGGSGTVADPERVAVRARDAAAAERDRAAGHAGDCDADTGAVGRTGGVER